MEIPLFYWLFGNYICNNPSQSRYIVGDLSQKERHYVSLDITKSLLYRRLITKSSPQNTKISSTITSFFAFCIELSQSCHYFVCSDVTKSLLCIPVITKLSSYSKLITKKFAICHQDFHRIISFYSSIHRYT